MISVSDFFCFYVKVFMCLRIIANWLGKTYFILPFSFIVFEIEEVLEQADYLYESGETEKLYQLLTQYKERWVMYHRPRFAVD